MTNMLEATRGKHRRWFALIRDARDGELRVIYRACKSKYKGISRGKDFDYGMYNGEWSVLMESQDQDYLRAFGRLTAPELRFGVDTHKDNSYFSYLEGRDVDSDED